jgi:hypothetical protein
VISTVPVPGLHVADETSLAFGDGKAFLTHPGGAIDAVDLRTGAASVHRPRRSLSKGDAIVRARWLAGRLLGVGNAVVDVRTWHARVLDPAATGLAPAGDRLVAYGPRGVGVYTRAGRVLFRALRRVSVRDVHVVGPLPRGRGGLGRRHRRPAHPPRDPRRRGSKPRLGDARRLG